MLHARRDADIHQSASGRWCDDRIHVLALRQEEADQQHLIMVLPLALSEWCLPHSRCKDEKRKPFVVCL